MISEIKGKISASGSNLTDRLEDKLTGDFFGTLQYLIIGHSIRRSMKMILISPTMKINGPSYPEIN